MWHIPAWIWNCRRAVLVAVLVMLPPHSLAQAPTPEPLLGQGRGVDHVGVGVHDLSEAEHDYEQLGFRVSQGGHFPGGLFNRIINFENQTYLELLSVKDVQGNKGDSNGVADFVKKHEGAMFLGLNVSSAGASANYLRGQSFDVEGPRPGSVMKEGDTKPPPAMWYTVGTADKPAPDKQSFTVPIFLIEYLIKDRWDKVRAESAVHPNSAVSIHAVWFAVRDLTAQLRTLRNAGLNSGETRDVELSGAHGREFRAGSGTMVLMGSRDKNDLVAKYLTDHDDDGIVGLSIEVSDLGKAHKFAESRSASKVNIYKGAYGQSFLLSPEATHGLWLELFEK
jgi:hypothetical protein